MSKAKSKSSWKLCESTQHISNVPSAPSSLKAMFVGGLYLEYVHKCCALWYEDLSIYKV